MSTGREHRKQLRLGMPVSALDGEVGRISKLIIDPQGRKPTYLVVIIGRLRTRREVVVPVSLVSSVTSDAVNLDVTRQSLADFPLYEVIHRKGSYVKPMAVGMPRVRSIYTPPANSAYMAIKQRSVPERSIAVEKGMLIRDLAGEQVGKVEGVILDQAQRQGKYILFRHDHFSNLQLIPSDLVEDASANEVMLRIGQEMAERLPGYA